MRSVKPEMGDAMEARQTAPLAEDPFDRFVARHQQRVARLVYRLLGWRGDVDDIVQDVFLTALRRFDQFRGESSEWTWLAAIAINRCRAYRRRRLLEFRWLRRRRTEASAELILEMERDETVQKVRRAVAALPDRDREVVVLYYLEDWSVAEISRWTKTSAGAIDVRLHRAREKLRKVLDE